MTEVCGDPLCRIPGCKYSNKRVYLLIYLPADVTAPPMHWFGCAVNGKFTFGNDKHLVHMTCASIVSYEVFRFKSMEWFPCPIDQPLDFEPQETLIFRPMGRRDTQCSNLGMLICNLYEQMAFKGLITPGVTIPKQYLRDPPQQAATQSQPVARGWFRRS